MENKIELYIDVNPYIVELADVLYEEFNDKTEAPIYPLKKSEVI